MIGYWLWSWHKGGSSGGDSFCKGVSSNSLRSAIFSVCVVKVVVIVMVLVMVVALVVVMVVGKRRTTTIAINITTTTKTTNTSTPNIQLCTKLLIKNDNPYNSYHLHHYHN